MSLFGELFHDDTEDLISDFDSVRVQAAQIEVLRKEVIRLSQIEKLVRKYLTVAQDHGNTGPGLKALRVLQRAMGFKES